MVILNRIIRFSRNRMIFYVFHRNYTFFRKAPYFMYFCIRYPASMWVCVRKCGKRPICLHICRRFDVHCWYICRQISFTVTHAFRKSWHLAAPPDAHYLAINELPMDHLNGFWPINRSLIDIQFRLWDYDL